MAAGNAPEEQATESREPETTVEQARPAQPEQAGKPSRHRYRPDVAALAGKTVGLLASLIRWIGLIFALILVVHVVLTVGGANKDNGITEFVRSAADVLAPGFKTLFEPDEPKLRVLVNYGIAAIFWLVVSTVLARIVRAIGGRSAQQ